MKKIKKILLFGIIGLVVVVIAAGIVVGFFLGDIARKAVVTVGPQVTKTTVALDAVDLSLMTGSAKVKGLVIGNPDGYKSQQAISVGSAAVSVTPMSVFSDKIVIRSVDVEAPEITFEGNPAGKNNLNDILANVNQVSASGGPPAANTNAPAPASGKPAKKLEVDDFVINNAKVHATVSAFGFSNKELTFTLPQIHLSNLGTGADGITATELSQRVLSEITSATVKEVANEVTKLGGGAGKAASDELNKLKQGGLGGLLGK